MSEVAEVSGPVGKRGILRRRIGVSYHNIEPIVATLDAVFIVLSSVLSHLLYQYVQYGQVADIQVPLGIGLADGTIFVFLSKALGLYRLPMLLSPARAMARLGASWLFVILLSVLVLFLLKVGEAQSRGSIISFAGFGIVSLTYWRMAVGRFLQSALARGAIHGRRALVIAEESELEEIEAANLLNDHGAREVGRIVLSGGDSKALSSHDRTEIAAATELAKRCGAEEVIVAVRWSNNASLMLIRESLQASPLPVRLIPDHFIKSLASSGTTCASASIELQRAPLDRMEQVVKRAADIALASCALVLLSPLLLLTALAIKLDSKGPVIFQQHRNGFNGEWFVIFKFRTMTVLEDGSKIAQARKSDPRVTRLGRMLRRSSIDELPQLFNVLKGDMSLVGPRPHALAHDTEYNELIGKYAFRHHVKPGITGWAQVHGFRGETPQLEDMTKRVELDLWYINNWSLWLDLRIMVRTCFELSRSSSAY